MDQRQKEIHWYERLPVEEKETSQLKRKKTKSTDRGMAMKDKKAVKLNKYMSEAENWIDEVAAYLKIEDRKDWAWNAIRGVLHGIRDRLTHEEAFQLSAQLPLLIRGMYFEGYHYGDKPDKFDVDELLYRIEDVMGPAANIKPEDVFKAVLIVLDGHITEGELNDIYSTMPKDIKKLWENSLKKYKV